MPKKTHGDTFIDATTATTKKSMGFILGNGADLLGAWANGKSPWLVGAHPEFSESIKRDVLRVFRVYKKAVQSLQGNIHDKRLKNP